MFDYHECIKTKQITFDSTLAFKSTNSIFSFMTAEFVKGVLLTLNCV